MKTLLYFTAPWCENCQALDSTMNILPNRGIPVEKINVDYDANRAKQCNVQNIPAIILVENGRELKRFAGVKSLDFIINFYNS